MSVAHVLCQNIFFEFVLQIWAAHVLCQNIFFDFLLQRTIKDKVHKGGFFCLVSILLTVGNMVFRSILLFYFIYVCMHWPEINVCGSCALSKYLL